MSTTGSKFSKLTWLREARPAIRKLTTTQRDVLDVIFDVSNPDGTNAHPGQAKLAEAAGVSDRQVRTILGQLQAAGLIKRTAGGNRKLKRADVYGLVRFIPEAQEFRYEKPIPEVPESIPEVSGCHTGSPGLPPNRSFPPDPGPPDPEMVSKGEDDPFGVESEPAPWGSVSAAGGSLSAADPFASLPSGSSAQGEHSEVNPDEHREDGIVSLAQVVTSVPSFLDHPRPWDSVPVRAEDVVRWPSGRPLPKPGEGFDPFATYVDEKTGELLTR